jgi:hypothetical protein
MPPTSVDLSTPVGIDGAPRPPQFTSQADIDSALSAADQAIRAASTPQPTTPLTDTAAGPARPARPASLDITLETTVDEAAQRLATDLRAVPGIERFADVRLRQLDDAGPRALRTIWRLARERLAEPYGEMTIGELLDRYGPGRRPS